MNPIGGFFELETSATSHYHADAVRLNTARNCLEYLLKARGYKKIFLPHYHCGVLQEPIRKLNIDVEFYSIDGRLDPLSVRKMKRGEAFLYINYFGMKGETSKRLAEQLGPQLILDNAQAFFEPAIEGIDTFYSPRKFFGVPDGAYLYTRSVLHEPLAEDMSYNRMLHLLKRIDRSPEEAYKEFTHNERDLSNQPIKNMSKLTCRLLASLDYEKIRTRRQRNYKFLFDCLRAKNLLELGFSHVPPMVYPFMTDRPGLRKKLLENRIFVASYWPNILDECDHESMEYSFATKVIPLPVDQRYSPDDLLTVTRIINEI